MSKAKNTFANLVRVLDCRHRLGLEEKTDEELQEILDQHQNSLYKRIIDLFGLPPAQGYVAKEQAIRGTLDYREMLREREERYNS